MSAIAVCCCCSGRRRRQCSRDQARRPSNSVLRLAFALLLTASLVSSSSPDSGRYNSGPPPPGGYRRNNEQDDDERYSWRDNLRNDERNANSWRPPVNMPREPPPPPPMGGYGGPSTPLPGAMSPPGQPQGESPPPGIHYNFPSTDYVDTQHEKEDKRRGKGKDDAEEYGFVPKTNLPPTPRRRGDNRRGPEWADPNGRGGPEYATARKDAVQRYVSTHRLGKLQIMSSSALIGYGVGAFVGRSTMNSSSPLAPILAGIFALLTILRNHYGELSKAMGLGLIMTVGRLGKVRRRYPTGVHLKAILGGKQREPFPPVFGDRENVWRYRVREGYEGIDPDFNMLKTVIAMALIGGFVGGNFPLVPTSLGGLVGAGALAFGTMLRGAKGDLYRTMGMRVISLADEVMEVVYDLRLHHKAGYTAGKVFDRVMFLDRKHGIRKKIGTGISFIAARVSKEVKSAQGEDDYDGGDYSDDDRRRRDRRRFEDDNDDDRRGGRRNDRPPPRRPRPRY